MKCATPRGITLQGSINPISGIHSQHSQGLGVLTNSHKAVGGKLVAKLYGLTPVISVSVISVYSFL